MKATPFNQKTIVEFHDKKGRGVGMWGDHVLLMTAKGAKSGDAIIRCDGEPVIIDLNAWPSYAKFRDKAAQAIADYLAHRFHRGPRAVI